MCIIITIFIGPALAMVMTTRTRSPRNLNMTTFVVNYYSVHNSVCVPSSQNLAQNKSQFLCSKKRFPVDLPLNLLHQPIQHHGRWVHNWLIFRLIMLPKDLANGGCLTPWRIFSKMSVPDILSKVFHLSGWYKGGSLVDYTKSSSIIHNYYTIGGLTLLLPILLLLYPH